VRNGFRASTNWRSVSTLHLKVGWARSRRWNANLALEKRTMEIHFTAAPIRASFNCWLPTKPDFAFVVAGSVVSRSAFAVGS